MSTACAPFRAELERALAGPPGALARLASQPHARSCPACRAKLLREQGLERLLARVPAPEVPSGLARRVLTGLARERRDGAAVRARLGALDDGAALAESELEALLERLPAPRVPAGLAGRVLRGVAQARAPRRARPGRRSWLLLAVAGWLAALGLWAWGVSRPAARPIELAQGAGAELEADEELLTYAVERWELLHDEDLDVWLASLDPLDELLMEVAGGEPWLDEHALGDALHELGPAPATRGGG